MEKIPAYIFLILLVFGCISVQAQDQTNPHTINNMDPKLNQKHGNAGTAMSSNPSRPTTPMQDLKLNSEIIPGNPESTSNAQKSSAELLSDTKIEAEAAEKMPREVIPVIMTGSKASFTSTVKSNEQPAGNTPKNNVSYRSIKGADTQPAASQPANVTDYRKMNGPNTQPVGEKPKR